MQQLPGNVKRPVQRLRRQIERLPPYPALLLVAGPLAVIEPLKFATIFIAGEGHWIASVLLMLFAYATSLFATHWLFVIVKPKLLTLRWFARPWAIFVKLRGKAWRWIGRRTSQLMSHGAQLGSFEHRGDLAGLREAQLELISTRAWAKACGASCGRL